MLPMAKKKKQIDKVVSSSSEFDELRKQNFRLSRRDKMLTDDFLLDSYDLKTHLYGAEFQANSRQLRRGIDGLFVGYPRDLFEQFQQLKLTESDSNRHLVTGDDASSLSIEILFTLLQQKSNATIDL